MSDKPSIIISIIISGHQNFVLPRASAASWGSGCSVSELAFVKKT